MPSRLQVALRVALRATPSNYYYLKMLLLIPEEAVTNAVRGCYEYLKRLPLIPEEAAGGFPGRPSQWLTGLMN